MPAKKPAKSNTKKPAKKPAKSNTKKSSSRKPPKKKSAQVRQEKPSPRTKKTAAMAKGGPRRKAASKPPLSARPRGASESTVVPETSAPSVSYDLVCPVEGILASGLTLGVCLKLAQEHNENNPGHDADCLEHASS